jgi:hypothetical protein
MEQQTTFDPSRHLIDLDGSQYLEVKWRLVWLRDQYPEARIETELVSNDHGRAIFKATVEIPTGARATGYGSESFDQFPDYIEAAETKAIGRSLAALGFGSQFCRDFDLVETHDKLVDSPVRTSRSEGTARPVTIDQPITDKQVKMISYLARDLKLSAADLEELVDDYGATELTSLSRRGASALIDKLQALSTDRATAS